MDNQQPTNSSSPTTVAGPPSQAPPVSQLDPVQAIAAINAVGTLQTPAEAADTDNIEPEWVDKAKQIVSSSRDDPFKQVNELHNLRVDYMKKRYNKDLTRAKDA